MKKKTKKKIEEIELRPLEVIPQRGWDTKTLVKKFIKKCKKEDVFKPLFEKRYFKSKSEKKREEKKRQNYYHKMKNLKDF